jgi:hypothetical protein
MEPTQIVIMVTMLLLCSGMSYMIGDLHGFLRGMEKIRKIYKDD